jgi:hypothetical protein
VLDNICLFFGHIYLQMLSHEFPPDHNVRKDACLQFASLVRGMGGGRKESEKKKLPPHSPACPTPPHTQVTNQPIQHLTANRKKKLKKEKQR